MSTNPVSRRTRRPRLAGWTLGGAALVILGLIASGGCNSSSSMPQPGHTPSPTPIPSMSPGPSPSPLPTANVFVVMDYPSIPPTTDPTFGEVQGYAQVPFAPGSAAPSTTPLPLPTISSQVITVHCNQNIQFFNIDATSPHTASLLNGPVTGSSWPPTFNNVNGAGTASPQLTPITYPQFSTGLLSSGNSVHPSASLVYSTGNTPGSFQFGDYYQYLGNPQMRTVITVVCP